MDAIADAFDRAGSGGVVKSLADSALMLAVEAAGVGLYRRPIQIGDVRLVGVHPTTGFADDPVNTVTGNFIEPECDLSWGGATGGLALERTYNSVVCVAQARGIKNAEPVGVFGWGWASVCDQYLADKAETLTWVREDGRHVTFPHPATTDGSVRAVGDNWWISLCSPEALPGFIRDTTQPSGRLWRISDNRGGAWFFTQTGAWLGACGGPGEAIAVVRGEAGEAAGLVGERGRSLTFEYSHGRIVSAQAGGCRLEYVYDEAYQRLVSVRTGGAARRYEWDEASLIARVVGLDGVSECVNTYDVHGRVIRQISRHGRESVYAYLPGGVTCVSDPDGQRANTWIADSRGRTVGIIDSEGYRQSMTYDPDGNLVQARSREGKVTRYSYTDRGLVESEHTPDGGVVRYEWDDHDRLISFIGPEGAAWSCGYANDTDRDPSRIIDPLGGITHIDWDNGLAHRITDPAGVAVSFDYDEAGNLSAVTNGAGETTQIGYDDLGHVASLTTPTGSTTRFTHDEAGRLTSRQDPMGATWTYDYDAAGRLMVSTNPSGAQWCYSYDTHGDQASVTDPLRRVTTGEHDDLGNLARVRTPGGVGFGFTHDALSRLRGFTDPAGGTWRYDYTPDGLLKRVSDPAGVSQTMTPTPTTSPFSTPGSGGVVGGSTLRDGGGRVLAGLGWDAYGRLIEQVDAAGGREIVTYDAAGRLVESLDADGGLTKIRRDEAGRVTGYVTPEGREWAYTYDAAGRVDTIIDPDGTTTRVTYDADSRVVALTTPVGKVASYTYDQAGRVVKGYVAGQGRFEYAYDHTGRVVYSRDLVSGIRRFTYDEAGQLVKVTNGLGGITRYVYDADGRVSEQVDPAGGITRYTYDKAGRLESRTDPAGRVTTVSYDAAGRVTTTTSPSTTWSYRYTKTGILESVACNGETISQITVDDTATTGRVIRVQDHTMPGGDLTHVLAYNRLGNLSRYQRVNGEVVESEYAWGWDRDGIRTHATITFNGVTLELPHATAGGLGEAGPDASRRIERDVWGRVCAITTPAERVDYTYNQANQLVKASSTSGASHTWGFDQAGRLTTSTTIETNGDALKEEYSYSVDGALTRIDTTRTRGGVAETSSCDYHYDQAGRRVQTVDSRGETTSYTWDRRGALTTITMTNPQGEETRLDTHVDVLGQLDHINTAPLHWDAASLVPTLVGIGNHTLPRSDRDRNRLEACDLLDPYQVGRQPLANLGLDGLEGLEDLVGLTDTGEVQLLNHTWMGARILDATGTSFLTPDPIPAPAGVAWASSPYTYVGNNPLNLIDPLGLTPLTDKQLAAYNNHAYKNIFHRVGSWIWDHRAYIVAGAMIGVGAGLMLTGAGGIIGAGIIAGAFSGAGTSIWEQKQKTGHVDTMEVLKQAAIGGAIGGVSFGAGSLAANGLLRSAAADPLMKDAAIQAATKESQSTWSLVNGTDSLTTKFAESRSQEVLTTLNRAKYGGDLASGIVDRNSHYLVDSYQHRSGPSLEGFVVTNGSGMVGDMLGGAVHLGTASHRAELALNPTLGKKVWHYTVSGTTNCVATAASSGVDIGYRVNTQQPQAPGVESVQTYSHPFISAGREVFFSK